VRRRILSGFAVAAVIAVSVTGLSGCSILGGTTVSHQSKSETNLEYQREVVRQFWHDYPNPDLQTVRFTDEGSAQLNGTWAASAVVTVAGVGYDVRIATYFSGGQGLPTVDPHATPVPVTVFYSDGTSEELK
jgi:hypothetical protein